MNRRGFLGAMLAAGIAPAIVRAESLMILPPAKPKLIVLYGDGIHDDTVALQKWINGGAVLRPDGTQFGGAMLRGEHFLLSGTVRIGARGPRRSISDSVFTSTPQIKGPLLHIESMERFPISDTQFFAP